MPRRTEKQFDPNLPVYAARKFTANGHRFTPGKLFDWKKMSVSQRSLLLLADQGKVSNGLPKPKKRKALAADPAPAADPAALPIPTATGDELDEIDDMNDLRRIAEAEGAPTRVSKVDQRKAIRENRAR